jgi:UDP-N-acetylmuramoyl-tripeptide--D-alanyl-D-alanine ligase
MTFWTGARVGEALGVAGPRGIAFSGVATDTRHLTPGSLFVALKGENFDAHDFLAQARAVGATGAVVRRGTARVDGLALFEVPDTLAALGALARARRRALPPDAPVVAITGSSGKTSTKEMIRAALAARWGERGGVHATTANLNNLVGVPLTILAAPEITAALVVEAGASIPGEIATLRRIIEPTIGVVTNVGYAHVEGFGSLQGVLTEKVSLLDGVPVGVVGTEPPALAVEARRRTRTLVAGRDAGADVRPDAAELDDGGRPVITWGGATGTVAAVGFHQIDNAMIALAVAREAGVEPAAALAALARVQIPGGRGRVVEAGGLTIVDDSYNANPSSLRAAVEFARWLAGRRRRPLALVLGSMLELGAESARLHAAAAAEIAAAPPDLVAAVGAFVPAFEPHRAALGARLVTAPDAGAVGPRLKAALGGNEIVLLKASRGVALERVLADLT